MDLLRRRALARLALGEAEVRRRYASAREHNQPGVAELCESHERLRAELQGAKVLLEDARREVAAVVKIMDELSATWGLGTDTSPTQPWGDEGLFRRCRDRLRGLLTGKEGEGR